MLAVVSCPCVIRCYASPPYNGINSTTTYTQSRPSVASAIKQLVICFTTGGLGKHHRFDSIHNARQGARPRPREESARMDAIRVTKVERVQLDRFVPSSSSRDSSSSTASGITKQRLPITLHLTPHHLVLSPTPSPDGSSPSTEKSRSILDPTQLTDEIWVPYPSITLLTRLPQTLKGLYPLQIRTRNFESYVLNFERDRDGGAEDVWQSVKDCAVSGMSYI